MLRRSVGLALIALSTGCGSQAAVCDDADVPSVFGTVVDEEGNGLPGALVTYTVDGEERGDCTFNEGPPSFAGRRSPAPSSSPPRCRAITKPRPSSRSTRVRVT